MLGAKCSNPTPFGGGTFAGKMPHSTSNGRSIICITFRLMSIRNGGANSLNVALLGANVNVVRFHYIYCVGYNSLFIPNKGTCGALCRLHANGNAVYYICHFTGLLCCMYSRCCERLKFLSFCQRSGHDEICKGKLLLTSMI